jgi:hypothetical protein
MAAIWQRAPLLVRRNLIAPAIRWHKENNEEEAQHRPV